MRGVASELFAIAVMAGGSYALIRWLGWILDSVDEAIDEAFGDVVELPREARATGSDRAGGCGGADKAARRNSHRTSPSSHKEQGA